MRERPSSSIERSGPGTPQAEAQEARATNRSYVDFGRHDTYAALSVGKRDGVLVRKRLGGAGEVRLVSPPKALHTATDGSGFYNGSRYQWGSLISAVCETATPFDTLVPSWNAKTLAGTWIELEVRVRSDGVWTSWFNMGVWASGTESVERHSVDGQGALGWKVATDILYSTDAWSVSPEVHGVFVTASDSARHGEDLGLADDTDLRGRELEVPARSQMVYPEGGEVWCSPASLLYGNGLLGWGDRRGEAGPARAGGGAGDL